jgi:hypothetical protein
VKREGEKTKGKRKFKLKGKINAKGAKTEPKRVR